MRSWDGRSWAGSGGGFQPDPIRLVLEFEISATRPHSRRLLFSSTELAVHSVHSLPLTQSRVPQLSNSRLHLSPKTMASTSNLVGGKVVSQSVLYCAGPSSRSTTERVTDRIHFQSARSRPSTASSRPAQQSASNGSWRTIRTSTPSITRIVRSPLPLLVPPWPVLQQLRRQELTSGSSCVGREIGDSLGGSTGGTGEGLGEEGEEGGSQG